jgi:hypothetical protein
VPRVGIWSVMAPFKSPKRQISKFDKGKASGVGLKDLELTNTLAYLSKVFFTVKTVLLHLYKVLYFNVYYGRNFLISYSVCPWQAFPALSNVCGAYPSEAALRCSTLG